MPKDEGNYVNSVKICFATLPKNAKRDGYGVYINGNKKEEGLWKDNLLEMSVPLDTSSILILSLDAAMKAEKSC